MKRKYLAIAVIALQILFLSSMVWFHNAKLRNAAKILLKTVPYDPVSIFRGHYASLRYEISSLPLDLLIDAKSQDLKEGDQLYVLLKKETDYWQAQGIYKKQPKRDGKVYLTGRLGYHYTNSKEVNLEYGIESFFLNEEKAKEVDRANVRQRVDWRQRDKMKQQRLNQLDEETKRIHKAGITEWWLTKLDNESGMWVKEGIITQGAKDAIRDKYAKALDKIKEIDKDLSSADSAGQKPVIVEVAVDRNGCGYPLRLFIDGKEYR